MNKRTKILSIVLRRGETIFPAFLQKYFLGIRSSFSHFRISRLNACSYLPFLEFLAGISPDYE